MDKHFDDIEALRSDFAAIGITDPHTACANWLGKPNRFSMTLMHWPQDVLEYLRQELADTQRMRADMKTGVVSTAAPEAGEAVEEPASNTLTHADRQRLQAANSEWRKAIQQRKDAVAQWDAYVEHHRTVFRTLRKQLTGK